MEEWLAEAQLQFQLGSDKPRGNESVILIYAYDFPAPQLLSNSLSLAQIDNAICFLPGS